MVTEVGTRLDHMIPITVTLGRVLYHPEAVVVAARPANALVPLLTAVESAAPSAIARHNSLVNVPWTPHVTIAYSRAEQPAGPIIAALGRELPSCDVTIRNISLVNQDGPEHLWNWHSIAEVALGASAPRET
jgi:2'-5' RNA ligase